ncbi:uncharacterized protein [Venturia canescens]|uniref:uncharacterized protein n=1 Tax=Venturia canescens TaxID=32260 RepID=UPI001C9D1442|nr:uncharacterized protein LOC122410468 [Venturia canescens]
MIAAKIATLVGVAALLNLSTATPDSAGIVEMVNGLAYGGIPYGSVTGMLARSVNQGALGPQQYYRGVQPQAGPSYATSRVIVTPNLRAAGIVERQQGPVQIYNLPGVVAPGIVGRFSQIGY